MKYITLIMIIISLILAIISFNIPGYMELGFMGLMAIAITLVVWFMDKISFLPFSDFAIAQTKSAFILGALPSLPFSSYIVYAVIGWLNEMDSRDETLSVVLLVIFTIVIRPVVKPIIAICYDKILRKGKIENLEKVTGKSALDSQELYQHARGDALSDAVYDTVIIGIALTKIFAQSETLLMYLNSTEQTMLIVLIMTVMCPVIFHLHRHQRDLRDYLNRANQSNND